MSLKKKIFINQLQEGQQIEELFRVANKELRAKKNDGKFLRLILADKSGEVISNMWDNFEKVFQSFQIDDYILVRGSTKLFQQKMQLTVSALKKVDSNDVDPSDFFMSSENDPNQMWEELENLINSIDNRYIKTLLESIFYVDEVKNKFKISPAAKALHHSFQSGLLEHTISLAKMCDLVSTHFSNIPVNRNLLIAGALLHDVGKIYELSYEKGYNYTDQGRLLGHITIEAIEIQKHIDKIDGFPEEIRLQLLHMILSHHGIYEYGSPKRPKTLEALILYYLDDLDSKVESMYKFIKDDTSKEKWAGFENRQFERFIYKGSLLNLEDDESE